MNVDDVRQLIAQGEGNTIEFKESLPVPAELTKAMVAFANTDGGWLLVGVTDRGDVRGVTFGDREAQLVLNVARNNCVPHLQPRTETVELDGKTVAVIRVERGRQKPYQANERIYVRIGASTRAATQVELLSMLQESGLLSFDQLPVLNATLDDLDLNKAREYLARQTDPARLVTNGDVLELLTHLKAVVRYEERRIPSIGGLLLFGKDPQRELMHSELRAARFHGRDVVGPITDKQDCRGTLPEIIDQATEFVRRNRRIVPRMEGIRRIDVEEYPLPAVREAIANAIAHRDYALTGSSIRLFLFDDRLEIISPGRLVFPVTLELLGHVRETRNRLIVRVLRDLGYIEDLGTGIRRIRAAMANSGLRPPIFAEEHHQFIITLYGAATEGGVAVPLTDEAVRWELNERQARALEYLKACGQITRSEYCTLTGVQKSTAHQDLQNLVSKGIVVRRGKGRGTRYVWNRPAPDNSPDD
jgi:ATP-dependent DNA helicase RecG